ncbi:GNAT family N-acetyltransferase [Microvirga rosea]|uniref:GNAT family N-acetyltransferase n=1 Tax=Microvirga rosea TaxID=2715425 RepID=UPI001D0BC45E|nr:N-acetyltransferase [Microvirga rosea]MCB8821692.1 N-acetyltransferase [Microvirga rosea]
MTPDLRIRAEEQEDRAAIHALHEAAFRGHAEAALVDKLRRDSDLSLSLVACRDRVVVGHIAFSPLALADKPDLKAFALAPLAVLPSVQRQGIGAALVEDGLQRLADDGADVILVLGEPGYYGDFGFEAGNAKAFTTPYDGPYLQALILSDKGQAARGHVDYAPAFAGLT